MSLCAGVGGCCPARSQPAVTSGLLFLLNVPRENTPAERCSLLEAGEEDIYLLPLLVPASINKNGSHLKIPPWEEVHPLLASCRTWLPLPLCTTNLPSFVGETANKESESPAQGSLVGQDRGLPPFAGHGAAGRWDADGPGW